MIEVGQTAPAFQLPDQAGQTRNLQEFAGSWLVLYFYPKDDTPGCTTQACSLRDVRDDLVDLGAQVVGISKDSPANHEKFKAKYSLNFTLLSDEDGRVIESYGAWGKKMFGREGILRKTFIISPDGKILKIFGRATPLGHGEAVAKALRELQA